ncbi:MAG: glycosyltransferase [Subdoligranulum sp.]|nr:glycosyltransferase [Subdoligranulum sp.]
MALAFDFSLQPGKTEYARFDLDQACNAPPRISVITPMLQTARCSISQFFYCMRNQTFPWFEWIVLCSETMTQTDRDQIDRFAREDPRIRLCFVSSDEATACNTAAGEANAEYLCFYEAGHLVEPPFLETLYLALSQEAKAGWAYSYAAIFGQREYLYQENFDSADLKKKNTIPMPVLVRARDFWQSGGFSCGMQFREAKWYLLLKLLAQQSLPFHVQQPLSWIENPAEDFSKDVLKKLRNTKSEKMHDCVHPKIRAICERIPDGLPAHLHYGEKRDFFADILPWNEGRVLPFARSKLRILLLLPHMVMGGADQFNLDLIAGLDPERFEVSIVTTLPNTNEWRQRFAQLADDIFSLTFFLDMEQWPAYLDYMVRTRNIDLVLNTNSYYGYFVLPWLHLRYPELPFIDYIHMEEWYYRHGGFARPSGAIGPFLDRTYVCNEKTRRVLIDHFGRKPESVQTVYIGVDETKFDPKLDITLAITLPEEYRNKPVILFPCRICKQKRPFLMLKIAKQLPQFVFVVVGDGLQFEELRHVCHQEGLDRTVYFAGPQTEMRPWYKLAALTLICSLKEGLSLTAYESLSMGIPVVTSDVGGQRELVDETVGRVIPLLQSESEDEDNRNFSEREIKLYVEAIQQVVSEAEDGALKARCRERILNGFTVRCMQQRMSEEFLRLTAPEECQTRRQRIEAFHAAAPLLESYADLIGNVEELTARQQRFELAELGKAQTALDQIYSMRTFKLMLLYQKIVHNSFLGEIRYFVIWLKHRLKGEAPPPPYRLEELRARNFDFTAEPGLKPLQLAVASVADRQPLVSIVTAFYNAGKYFEQTYRCVLAQTFPWFEWIIVDDGSTDMEDLRLLNRFAATDTRIKVIHRENGKLPAARNTGFANSASDVIIPLDADDLIEPTYVEYLYFALRAAPEAAWAYTDSVGFGSQQYLWRRPFSNYVMKTENLLVATAAIRREAFLSVGGYKVEKYAYNEDWRFWLECMQKGLFPVHAASYQFWYRRSEQGMLSGIQKDTEVKLFSENIIRNAAKDVPVETRKIEYPESILDYEEGHAFAADFKESQLETNHGLLVVLRELKGMESIELCARAYAEHGIPMTIVLEKSLDAGNAQYLRNLTDRFYCLDEFLSCADWKEFVQYLLYVHAPKTVIYEEGASAFPLYPEAPPAPYQSAACRCFSDTRKLEKLLRASCRKMVRELTKKK